MIEGLKTLSRFILVSVLWYFPRKSAHEILYFFQMKKKLELNMPMDFNEKIQWLIIYKYGTKEAKLADKYLVRNYVEKAHCGCQLAKLYGCYRDVDEIDYDKLPDSFVLKTNHGCGGVFICKDKANFNFDKVKKELSRSLKKNYSRHSLEYHYQYIKPCIICEEYLNDGLHFQPEDYKFYCFNGRVDCIMLCSNRENNLRLDYYDRDWNYLDYSLDKYRSNINHSRPRNLKKMIKIAEKLSKGFEYVRVDLYEIGDMVFFGELTFTPASGMVYYNTDYALKRFGELIKIKR